MELHRASHARSQGLWTTEDLQSLRDPQRRPLPPKVWMPVVAPASSRGEDRGYEGGKKVKGLKSVTSWWTPKASCSKLSSTECQGDGLGGDKDATAAGGEAISSPLSVVVGGRLAWGGQGQGDWVEKTLGWSVDLVERPRESPPPKRC